MRHIAISFERSSWLIERIEIEGIRLSNDEIDAFAIADGFGGEFGSPRFRMGRFWLENHGFDPFEGVVIGREPQV